MRCPRRAEHPTGPLNEPNALDEFGAHGCTFCGSISPAQFFELAEQGAVITPTDKTYKVYVAHRKFYFMHFSEAEMRRFVDLYNSRDVDGKPVMKLDVPGYFYTLPYFMGTKKCE